MDAKKLFEEGVEYERRALENTQFTHVHSVEIREEVFRNKYLPAAQDGYPPAMEEVANYYMQDGQKIKSVTWVQKYKRATGASTIDIIYKFGAKFIN